MILNTSATCSLRQGGKALQHNLPPQPNPTHNCRYLTHLHQYYHSFPCINPHSGGRYSGYSSALQGGANRYMCCSRSSLIPPHTHLPRSTARSRIPFPEIIGSSWRLNHPMYKVRLIPSSLVVGRRTFFFSALTRESHTVFAVVGHFKGCCLLESL